jgi:hypothetical protein
MVRIFSSALVFGIGSRQQGNMHAKNAGSGGRVGSVDLFDCTIGALVFSLSAGSLSWIVRKTGRPAFHSQIKI